MYSSSIILTEDRLREVVDYFLTKNAFAFDVEAHGEYRDVPHLAQLSWVSLATEGMAVVIPFGHEKGDNIVGTMQEPRIYGPKAQKAGQTYYVTVDAYDKAPQQLTPGKVAEILRPLFFKPGVIKIGHDVVYDLVSIGCYLFGGEIPPPPYGDTKIGGWLLDENRKKYGLKDDIEKIYSYRYDYENIGACVESFCFNMVAFYNYCDSIYAWIRWKNIIHQIIEQELTGVYNLEMDVLHSVIGMRISGARIDRPATVELKDILSKRLTEAEGRIYQSAGQKFNINSNQQKQQILYGPVEAGGQGLKPWRLTKGGMAKEKAGIKPTIKDYSVDSIALQSYPGNPVAINLLKYSTVETLLTSFVDPWLGTPEKKSLIHNDHIYAGFQQYGTVTGRFSCKKPNMQNIPRPHSELGRLVRGVFVAEPEGKLVVADYSQIELVVLAHYLGEGKLYEGFLAGIDPHTMTAAMVLDKRPEDVTKVERQDLGKTLGFAVVYGAGLGKVASMAKVTVPRAKEILRKHAQMFPEIHGFKDDVIQLCRERDGHYITTLFGRKRRVPMIMSRVEGIRKGAERQVFNSLIQGGAADLIKLAMVRVDRTLPPEIQCILTVHDEIVLSSPDSMTDYAEQLLLEAMIGQEIQQHVRVPLKAEVHTVSRWSEAK